MTVGSSSLHPPQQGGGSGRGGGPWPRVARSARLLLGGAAAAAGSGPAAASAAAAGSGAAASAASTSATMLRARLQAHMGRAWIGYSAALRHSPLITKCVTGVVGTLISDFIAQLSGHHMARAAAAAAAAASASASAPAKQGRGGDAHHEPAPGGPDASYTKEGSKPRHPRFRYDFDRTLRLVVWSIFVATPIAHFWFNALDTRVMPSAPTSNAAVATKLLLDQLLMAPAGTALFFFGYRLLEGGSTAEARASLRERFGPTMAANYVFWPAANIINFKFIPPEQRILYVNAIAIIWGSFMSHMANRKPAVAVAAAAAAAAPAGQHAHRHGHVPPAPAPSKLHSHHPHCQAQHRAASGPVEMAPTVGTAGIIHGHSQMRGS